MARTTGLTLGFTGAGEVSEANAETLLVDYIEANGGRAKFLVPLSKDTWTKSMRIIAELALNREYPLEVVADPSAAKVKTIKTYLDQADRVHKVADVGARVLTLLSEASAGRLIALWDDEDEEGVGVVEAALDAGIEALDLTSGLELLRFADDEPEPDEPEPDEPEPDDESEPESDDDDDENDDLPRPEEVDSWDFTALKEFARRHGIPVGPRTRTPGYRQAIQDWLRPAESSEPDDDDEFTEPEPEDVSDLDGVTPEHPGKEGPSDQAPPERPKADHYRTGRASSSASNAWGGLSGSSGIEVTMRVIVPAERLTALMATFEAMAKDTR
jgi:hypothetical protein